MNLEAAQLIQTAFIEAIRTLGPAVIAYLAAALPLKARIKELEFTNTFRGKEHLFAYYQKRQDRLDSEAHEIAKGLGTVLGIAAGAGNEPSDEVRETVDAFKVLLETYLVVLPVETEITLRDMQAKQLTQTAEFRALSESQNSMPHLAHGASNKELRECVTASLSAYASLQRCNQLLLEKKAEAIFKE